MKFLCVCRGGNVRSAALAYLLKEHGHQDAVAVGAERNSEELLTLLWNWADYVVIMSAEVLMYVPADLLGRGYALVEVGPDRYGNPFHTQLQEMLAPVVADWANRGWNLLTPATDEKDTVQ